jgi:hypothetical protein
LFLPKKAFGDVYSLLDCVSAELSADRRVLVETFLTATTFLFMRITLRVDLFLNTTEGLTFFIRVRN